MFRVGQKVVCVDGGSGHTGVAAVKTGNIYVVRDCGPELNYPGEWWVLLEGIFNVIDPDFDELGYDASRFRPVVERKTDISIFTAMLTPTKVRA